MNIKNLFTLIFIVFFISGCSSIKPVEEANTASDADFLTDIFATFQDSIFTEAEEEKETDALLKSTQIALETTAEPEQDFLNNTQNQTFNNVWPRLIRMYQFSDIDNKRIDTQKKWYIKHKRTIEKVSQRATPYLYFIAEEVDKRNMPGEIALLPVIESSFRPTAYSHMRASGLWQFVPATGRYFKLKQNWWYDGRRDVYKSTLAALTYLQQLHKYYKGDWLLALAAYNAGAGNVNKAIRKNLKKGKPIDYWSLSLPRETYKYVAKLIAVSRVIQDHNKHNITLASIKNEPFLTLVDTQSQIELSVAAKIANISMDEMHAYNPAFKRWATDPDGPHHLFIPVNKARNFKTQLASIDRMQRVKSYRHKIRSGENLGVIAQNYGISITLLKQANRLKSNRIRTGKYLFIPLDGNTKNSVSVHSKKSKSTKYTVRSGDSFWLIARRFNISHNKLADFNNLSRGDTLSIGQILHIPQTIAAKNKKNKKIVYKVRSGDSLYTISKQFRVSITDLKRWNRLSTKQYLQPGQKLKVFITDSQSS